MTFQLVYYSQQDPKWKKDILGFGEPGDTIGYVGCALTSVAMLLSGHGFTETPRTLNQKLKKVNGFVGAAILWSAVSQIYPQVNLKSFVSCVNTDAPLKQIDASLAAGQPVIVMVDSTPAAGISTHWVVLYAKEGSDYLMLDPWPYQTDVNKKTYLMPRYSQGKNLKRAIMHVVIYEVFNTGGVSAQTGAPTAGSYAARVKAEVTAGLNIRSSTDTSSAKNIVDRVSAGAMLTLFSAEDYARVGAINQWVRVQTPSGAEGMCAAWYLEKAQAASTQPSAATPPASSAASTAAPAPTAMVGSTSQNTPASIPVAPSSLVVSVLGRVGKFGANIHQSAFDSSAVLANEKARAKIFVLEAESAAKKKIGKAGKWLKVQTKAGVQGYVRAELVK